MQFFREDAVPAIPAAGACYVTRDGVNNSSVMHFVSEDGSFIHKVGHLDPDVGGASGSIETYEGVGDFPAAGAAGTLYLDESTGDIHTWNSDTSSYGVSGGSGGSASFATEADFPVAGEVGVMYIDESTGGIFTWNGTEYLSSSVGGGGESFATEVDFPATGATGVLYIDESTGGIFTWNGIGYVSSSTGGGGESFATEADFPAAGETGTLYIDESTGGIFTWNGTEYASSSTGGGSASFATEGDFPAAGETGTLYVAEDTGGIFTWNGTEYLSSSTGGGSASFAAEVDFPAAGEVGTLYIAEDTGGIFTWNGTEYVSSDSSGSGTLESFATEGDFPAAGEVGTLYIAEDTGDIFTWDTTASEYVTTSGGGGAEVFATEGDFPATGVVGTMYLASDTDLISTWNGSGYNTIVGSLRVVPGFGDLPASGSKELLYLVRNTDKVYSYDGTNYIDTSSDNIAFVNDIAERDALNFTKTGLCFVDDASADTNVIGTGSATYYADNAGGHWRLVATDSPFLVGYKQNANKSLIVDHCEPVGGIATTTMSSITLNIHSRIRVPGMDKSYIGMDIELRYGTVNKDVMTTLISIDARCNSSTGFDSTAIIRNIAGVGEVAVGVEYGKTLADNYCFTVSSDIQVGVGIISAQVKNIRGCDGSVALNDLAMWKLGFDTGSHCVKVDHVVLPVIGDGSGAMGGGGGGTTITGGRAINLVFGDGSFCHSASNRPVDRTSTNTLTDFDPERVLMPVNGATFVADNGMVWDTDSLGGAGDSIHGPYLDFLSQFSLAGRYSPSFCVNHFTAGTGTNRVDGYNEFHTMFGEKHYAVTDSRTAFGVGMYCAAIWIYVASKHVLMHCTHFDGVSLGGNVLKEISVDGKWHHVALVDKSDNGLINPFAIWAQGPHNADGYIMMPYIGMTDQPMPMFEHLRMIKSST